MVILPVCAGCPAQVTRRNKWILWYAVTLHSVWAVLLLVSETPLSTAPLAGLAWAGRWGAAAVFATVACLACWSLLGSRAPFSRLWLVLPQQFIMMSTGLHALSLIIAQHYADGVVRPWPFIAADQAPAIIAMVWHTVAILEVYGPTWIGLRLLR